MVQPAVAFRRQPRVLFQPRGRGEQLVFGNDRIVLAVSEIYRYLEVGQPVIRRRGAGHVCGREESRQVDDGAIAFRVHAQQMDRDGPALRKPDRHDVARRGDVAVDPLVDRACGGRDVVIQVVSGRHSVMEPAVCAGRYAFRRVQDQRRSQRHHIVVGGDVLHDSGDVAFIGSPSMQREEQRPCRHRFSVFG